MGRLLLLLCNLMALSHIAGGTALAGDRTGRSAEGDPLVAVIDLIPDAVLDVRYATAENFLGRAVYPFPAVYLIKSTAEKLAKAARDLRKRGCRLLIFDGYRPLSVQKLMWEVLPDPRFVADPRLGSWHNKGGAVDLALASSEGRPLEMPTAFDDFTVPASKRPAAPSRRARRHHAMLRRAMRAAGFEPLEGEWWHYHDPATRDYPLLDRSFEELGAAAPR